MRPTGSSLQAVGGYKPTVGDSTGPHGIDMSQQFPLARGGCFLFKHLFADSGLDAITSNQNVTGRRCTVDEAQL